jgi:hypothetical protein
VCATPNCKFKCGDGYTHCFQCNHKM